MEDDAVLYNAIKYARANYIQHYIYSIIFLIESKVASLNTTENNKSSKPNGMWIFMILINSLKDNQLTNGSLKTGQSGWGTPLKKIPKKK